MAFNKNIPNFLGGKTQDPFTQRQDNELEDVVNCFNSLNKGLIPKPGSYNVADLVDMPDDILNLNKIEHKNGFLIVDSDKKVSFFKKDGTKYTTSFESAQAETNFDTYLSGTTDLGFLNLNDLTYLFNRNVDTKVIEPVEPEVLDTTEIEGYIYVKNVVSGKEYKIDFDLTDELSDVDIGDVAGSPGNRAKTFVSLTAGAQSQKQFARELISAPIMATPKFATDKITANNFYDTPETIFIESIGVATLTSDMIVTITGDRYDEDSDTFFRDTKEYTFLSGTDMSTRTEIDTIKWGSVKHVIKDTNPSISFSLTNSSNDKMYIHFTEDEPLIHYSVIPPVTGFEVVNISPWDIYPVEDIIVIKKNDNIVPDFAGKKINNITTTDEFDSINMYQIFGTMKTLDLLPPKFFHDVKIKISGNPVDEADDYYVVFQVNNSTTPGEFGSGVWEETGVESFLYDLTTMPFSLIIDDTLQTVLINDGGWKERAIGDTESNKDPYFINKKINDIFIYGSKLAILSGGDKVDLSGTNDFYNLYRTTVLTNLESDRISIIVTSDKLINLTRAVPFNEKVLLIDDNTQFLMSYEGGLSINTLSVQEISNFNTKSKLKPIRTNDSLFFVSDYSNNSQIIKFSSRDISLVQGLEITQKIQSLIPNKLTSICTNNANDLLFAHKKNDDTVYMYTYKMFAGEGEYGSWAELKFTGYNILYIDCIDDELFLFCNGGGTGSNLITLFKVNLSNDTTYENGFENEYFRIHLDGKKIFNVAATLGNIDGSGNQTQHLGIDTGIPFGLINAEDMRVISTGDNDSYFKYGHNFTITDAFDVAGILFINFENPRFDLAATEDKYIVDEVLVGEFFDVSAVLSKVNLKNRDGLSMNSGTTQLLALDLTFGDTGGFILNTEITNAGSYDEVFTGKVLGSPNTVTGEISLETGSHSFYLGADKNDIKITIKNLDYLPFQIQNGSYEIEYDSRTNSFR